MTADAVTIIRCKLPLLLAKRIAAGRVQAYDRVKTVDLFVRAVDGLGELEERLRELLDRPDCAIVRGAPLDPNRIRGVQRLIYPDPKTGAPASLKAQPRFWLALDFDGLPVPDGLDLADLAACGKYVRNLLPAVFHNVSCIVQATASHGIASGLRLRTWHWLSRPTREPELKTWLKGYPIDASLFSPAQIHYTARPLFSGHFDPLPERLVVLFAGEDIVTVPDPAILNPPRRQPRPPPALGSVRANSYAALILAQVATAVLRAPEGQRHRTIVIGAHRLAELEQAGLLHPGESDALLTRAARGAGFDDERITDVGRILIWARRACSTEIEGGKPMNDGGAAGTSRIDGALEIARLASLDPITYEREREAAAEKLGVRTSVLDRLVIAARGDKAAAKGQGRPVNFPEVEPWGSPVDGAALLAELVATLGRFIVMTTTAKGAAALWVIHTYLFDRALITPRLIIKSSQKRCGKTSLLMMLGAWVRRPLDTAGITPASLYRTVEMSHPAPTLLIDEADHFLGDNHRDDLRAMLNAGFSQNGQVLRVVGEDHEPRQFSCHCLVVLALVGRLWDTLEDRAIQLRLQRRRRDEDIEGLSATRLPELQPIARRIARWVRDHGDAIVARAPQLPGILNDRAADCWRLLCAIADEAGGTWPEQARAAAVVLSQDNDDTETVATRLLRDLRELFDATPSGVLFSAEIVISLLAREEHGWAEMGRTGKRLSTIGLARLLHPFHIIPNAVRRGFDVAKGYQRHQFEDAWVRYL